MLTSLLTPLLATLVMAQSNSPLLNYQRMEELKQQVAELVVEIEVVTAMPEGVDASVAPRLLGQGVCLRAPDGKPRLVTSLFLVKSHSRLGIRSRSHPEWLPARVADRNDEVGMAVLEPREGKALPCQPVEPVSGKVERPGSVVVSIDNPVAWTNVFWGNLGERAEPPLVRYRMGSFGFALGCPLFSLEGRLVGLNLRPYTPGSKTHLTATASLLLRALFGARRGQLAPVRAGRRR